MEHTRAFLAYDTLCRIAAEIPEDGEQLLEQCEEEAHGLERTLSMFDPDSELSRLCRDIRPGEAVPVSETLYTFLEQNLEICRLSSGAFDPTVGPVVKLWDFLSQTPRIPSAERIRAVLDRVNLTLKPGERLGLTAPSGRGKTTLCKLLAGYEKPKEGEVLLDGRPLAHGRGYCPVQMIWQHPETVVDPLMKLGDTLAEGWPVEQRVLDGLRERFAAVDRIAEANQAKVLAAMQKNRVSAACFAATTGYGYDDVGRDKLERVYADTFHTEAALVRPQITCGTHALTVALSANLLPGDELLSPVGAPYDTLEEVIGIRPSACSLKEYGVHYRQVDLLPDYGFDYPAIEQALRGGVKLVTIQRSKGYATRPTFSVQQIGELIAFCKRIDPNVICMVDNCYGEFVETIEPSDVGADMIVGSLIKNPGGGLAPIGGYICGTAECVERCAYRLSAPGLGQEVGANLGLLPSLYEGFFLAPNVVSGALKGAIFAANVYERLGFRVVPNGTESRHDIIQAVELGSAEGMLAFCRGIQAAAPVDSYVTPVPWAMPGYDAEVVMAAGAFVQGSSIELSADGPIREPYAVYFQGGLTWHHAKLGILMSLQKLVDAGLAKLPE